MRAAPDARRRAGGETVIQREFLQRISQRVFERRQVGQRIGRVIADKTANRRMWVGALVEEVVRATLLEVQAEANRAVRRG